MKHMFSLKERGFLAKYITTLSAKAKADKRAKKMMEKIAAKMQASSTYVTLSKTEYTFLLNMCKGGVALGEQRLKQLRSLSWVKKLVKWRTYRKVSASLGRLVAGHKRLIEKMELETKYNVSK